MPPTPTDESRKERKRKTDRAAQREHRKRQKQYIEGLEAKIELLQRDSPSEQLPRIMRENDRLTLELSRLQGLFSTIHNAVSESNLLPAIQSPGLGRDHGRKDSFSHADEVGSEESKASPVSHRESPQAQVSRNDNGLSHVNPKGKITSRGGAAINSEYDSAECLPHNSATSTADDTALTTHFLATDHDMESAWPIWSENLGDAQNTLWEQAAEVDLSWSTYAPGMTGFSGNMDTDKTSDQSKSSGHGLQGIRASNLDNDGVAVQATTSTTTNAMTWFTSAMAGQLAEDPATRSNYFVDQLPSHDQLNWRSRLSTLNAWSQAPVCAVIPKQPKCSRVPLLSKDHLPTEKALREFIRRERTAIETGQKMALAQPSLLDFFDEATTDPTARAVKDFLSAVRTEIRLFELFASFKIISSMVVWYVNQDLQSYNEIPPWMRPTKVQLTIAHPLSLWFMPWPKLRDAAIIEATGDSRLATEILTVLGRYMEVNMTEVGPMYFQQRSNDGIPIATNDLQRDPTYDTRLAFDLSCEQSHPTPESIFCSRKSSPQQVVSDLGNWTLKEGFFTRFPHWKELYLQPWNNEAGHSIDSSDMSR